jgi:hypothetical protein
MLKKKRLSKAREIMTLPDERYRAIKMAEQLLRDLCDRTVTPRVPRVIRTRAASALRHYPGSYDLQQLERAAPHVVQQHMEPLYKMVLQHDLMNGHSDLAAGMLAAEDDHEGSTLD